MVLPTLALIFVILTTVLFILAVSMKIFKRLEERENAPKDMPISLYQLVRVAGEKEIEKGALNTTEYPNCGQGEFDIF
ncbi:toxin-antitoxin system, toxin component domain protein [Oesophagostomum dentatum]|uniref:Toxin-antitoxin system, toxin component domain protein n=1 Tax=Oesophagostomum dentatum TaxID=61180 RepID=A0A0B1SL54_OESDE|nr:toxin-antitoxin system, toxin component domain protein [Oesophagostomum dentatum]